METYSINRTYRDKFQRKAFDVNRRRFLQIASMLGLSGAGANQLTKTALAESNIDPQNEVLRLHGWKHTNHQAITERGAKPKREPVYYTIPVEDWLHTEGAKKVATKLSERFSTPKVSAGIRNRSDNPSGMFVRVTYAIQLGPDGEPRTSADSVEIDRIRDAVPNSVPVSLTHNGRTYEIDVDVEFTTVRHKEQGCYYDKEYRPVRGGCAGNDYATKFCSGLASICTPASHDDHGWVHTTAAHVVNDNDDEDNGPFDNPVYQPETKIGEVKNYKYNDGDDVAVFSLDGVNPGYYIAETSWPIKGTMGSDRIDDLISNNGNIYIRQCLSA